MWDQQTVWKKMRRGGLCLLLFCVGELPVFAQTASLRVTARDEQGQPVAAVKVTLLQGTRQIAEALTDADGAIVFSPAASGAYTVTISKDGFETLQKPDVAFVAGTPLQIEFVMVPRINVSDKVDIKATETFVNPVDQGASPSTDIQRQQAKDAATRPDTVSDALPLLPGIVRSDQGQLRIFGAGENRSALIVNYADVTDPATGQFGVTIPIDSVQTINVFRTPYLAQYGRFSAGVVSVETRRGGAKWNFELNDPLPEFRFLRSHLRGLREASPRVTFNGPLIKDKLFFSQGIEYTLSKPRVMALPFPVNESIRESVNSFTQLDYVASATHSITATAHITPRKGKFFNLDFFNPRPVTPNFSARDYTGSVIDRLTFGANLLESVVSAKIAGEDVWPQAPGEMTLTPVQNRGSYFNRQDRNSRRLEWLEIFSLAPRRNFLGEHNVKLGGGLTRTHLTGLYEGFPINIRNFAGRLLERIEYVGARAYNRTDNEAVFFGQDHLVVNSRLALDLGLRMERQSITSVSRVMPRAGLAWTPFGNTKTVIRTGLGLFFDRVPLNVFAFGRVPRQIITQYDPATGAVIDGPREYLNITDYVAARPTLFATRRYTPGNFAPYSKTWTLEAEHPLTKSLRLRLGYQSSESYGQVILNPGTVEEFDAHILGGGGESSYRQFEATARVTFRDQQEMIFSYVRSRSRGDLNEFNNFLGSFPQPIVRLNVRTNLPADMPNRFLAWGQVKLPAKVRWAPLVEYRNGFPYYVVNALQQYVGTPNADNLRYPTFFSLDSRFTRDFRINEAVERLFGKKLQDPYAFRFSVSMFNITNHFNPPNVRNNMDDPQFGLFFGQNKRRVRLDFDVIF